MDRELVIIGVCPPVLPLPMLIPQRQNKSNSLLSTSVVIMMVLEIDRQPHLEEEIARNQKNTCYRLSYVYYLGKITGRGYALGSVRHKGI